MVRAIAQRLDAAAEPRTREWWERYLKGALPFRGVPMAGIRAIVREVWDRERLDALDVDARVEVALRQLAERCSEDKLAGVLMLAERLLHDLRTDDVARLARPFERRHVEDWSTCDWYCVKVLGPFVAARDSRRRARLVAAWRDAESLWQRRAAAVAFVNLAPQGDRFYRGFTRLLLTVCERNVRDDARFSQTSVGWLLRELSKGEPEAVRAFVDLHRDRMSKEALRAATARLAP